MCQIRTGRGCVRVEGLSEITLKGVEQKRGEGKQRFLKGDKLGQGVGALKREGWNPLMNYGSISLLLYVLHEMCIKVPLFQGTSTAPKYSCLRAWVRWDRRCKKCRFFGKFYIHLRWMIRNKFCVIWANLSSVLTNFEKKWWQIINWSWRFGETDPFLKRIS